jgi:hypothetical protein
MINYINSTLKILFFNLMFLLLFIFIIEIFFGYWFDKNNFGPYMREHRMKNQKIEYSDATEKKKFYYRRNYYGFRGKDIEPKDMEAIIIGGSVIDERHKPEEYTITGFLNQNLKDNNVDLVITNAGIEAMSSSGIIHGFNNWFFKLKDFSPKFILFYIGNNDLSLGPNDTIEKIIKRHKKGKGSQANGHILNPDNLEVFFDNLKTRSILYDTARIFKFKYLPRKNFVKFDGKVDQNYLEANIKFKSYKVASEEYSEKFIKKKYNKRIKNYLDRIDLLYKLSKQLGSTPIFITTIQSKGHLDNIFALNTSLIKHCSAKKYKCINLAKKLNGKTEYWYDGVHSSKKGSEKIAKIIYEDFYKILNNFN